MKKSDEVCYVLCEKRYGEDKVGMDSKIHWAATAGLVLAGIAVLILIGALSIGCGDATKAVGNMMRDAGCAIADAGTSDASAQPAQWESVACNKTYVRRVGDSTRTQFWYEETSSEPREFMYELCGNFQDPGCGDTPDCQGSLGYQDCSIGHAGFTGNKVMVFCREEISNSAGTSVFGYANLRIRAQ